MRILPVIRFHHLSLLTVLLLVATGRADESRSAIQTAKYSGVLSGSEIIDGELELQVTARGSQQTIWNWSEVTAALTSLTWGDGQSAVIGLALNEHQRNVQQLVVIPQGQTTLNGTWSHQGVRENGRVVFDMVFPPSLDSTLELSVPSGVQVTSVNATVQDGGAVQRGMKNVVIEFSGTRLRLTVQTPAKTKASKPSCNLDTLYVLRRDGVFIQSTIAVESPGERVDLLQLELPRTADVEGITSGGIRLDFERVAEQPDLIRIPLNYADPRFTIRIQAFQPLRWNRRKLLPRISLSDTNIEQHQATLRAEKPLEIITVLPQGFLPTGLTVQGETIQRQFKAYTTHPQLFVDAQFPEPELETDVEVYAEESGRAITLIDVSAVQGQTFESTFDVPEGCDVVSVQAVGSKSQLASWHQLGGKLRIEYREPVMKGERRSILVTTQATPIRDNVFSVLFPILRNANHEATRVFVGTPDDFSATGDADGWNSKTTGDMDATLRTVADPSLKLTVLEHNGSSVWTWPFVIFATPDPDDEIAVISRDSNQSRSSFQDVIARCQLNTDLGPTRTSELIHHFTAEFSEPVSVSDLQIDLSPDARISSVVIDEEAVSVLRNVSKLEIPRDTNTISRLELVYWTQRTSTPMMEENLLPVPELSIPVSQLLWTVRAPASQRIASLRMGDTSLDSDLPDYLGTKFFGPLSQVYWLRKRPNLERAGSMQLFLPSSSGTATIQTWDTALLEQLAWISFVACLMTGVGLRLFHVKWISSLSLVWLLTLSCMLIWMPDAVSVLVGGMVCGTVISLVLPRKLIHARDFMAPISEWAPAKTAMILLLAMFSTAQAQTESESSLDFSCILTSANYQVVSLAPSTEVIADFDVFCLDPDRETQILLPLTGITFPQGGMCRVDGETSTLIPTLDGSGCVISLPASSSQKRTIQIAFAVRPNEREDDTVLWEIGIPPVVNSTLVTPNAGDIQFQHRGASFSDGENIRIQLGAIETLSARRAVPRVRNAVKTLVSSLRLNPLHASGKCFVEVGQGEFFTLNFPSTFHINKVVGSVEGWNWTKQDDDSIDVFVRLNQSEPRGVEIDFDLPLSTQSGKVNIPAFPTNHPTADHLIGLTAEPGFQVEPAESASRVARETWNALNLPLRIRPTSVVRMTTQPVEIGIERLQPARIAKIAETVNIQRKELKWQALVTIDVQNLPVFEHVFQVDQDLVISAIERVEDNNKFGVWKRSGQRLVLVVPNGQVGPAQFRFTGTMPLSAEVWRTIPEFNIDAAKTDSQNLVITDESGWNLQLETNAGTNIQSNAFPGQPDSRVVGTYSRVNRPFRIKISPPASLTRYEVVSYMRFLPGVDPEIMSTFQFFAEDVPLRKVDIQVPHGLNNVRVRPSHLRRTTTSGTESDQITLRWGAGRQSSAVTISGQWASPDEAPTLPQAKSNVSQDRYLLMAADSPMTLTPTAGRVCTESDLPAWADRIVRLAQRDGPLTCYQIVGDKLEWEVRETHTVRPPTLVESLMWPQSTIGVTGRSNIWFAPGYQFTIELPVQEGVRVNRVMDIFGNAIPYEVDDGLLSVQLDQQDHAMVSVMWNGDFSDGLRTPFRTAEDSRQIVGIWKDDKLRSKAKPDDDWTIRFARCQAMFTALSNARVSISLDSPLMQQVRQLVSELELASKDMDESHPLYSSVSDLLAQWGELQRKISITADDPVLTNAIVTPVDSLLDGHIAFDWWVTDENWTTNLGPQKKSLAAPILATCFVTFLWGGLLFRFEGQFRNLADHLATYPGLILIFLGTLWVSLLSPVQMGYALIGVGFVSELLRWLWPEPDHIDGAPQDVEN